MSECGYGCGTGEGPKNPIIYVFPMHSSPVGDCAYIAVAEDGEEIASHISSSPDWGMRDMGVHQSSRAKHDLYAKKYPGGYSLRWVDDWKSNPFLSKQADANRNAGVGQTEMDSQ